VTERPDLDSERIIRVLNDHGVRYVVIGATAAIAQGAPLAPTLDLDVTPAADHENLGRLSAALRTLDAKIRVDEMEDGLSFDHSAASLAGMSMLNLTSPYGDFDLVMMPAGTGGYDDLEPRAHRVVIGKSETKVADLADIIQSKEAAGRPKDQRALPALREWARTQRAVNKDTKRNPSTAP
jgi:hypothetical protein